MVGAAWAAVMGAACLEPATIQCDDGSLCPAGFVCQADGACASAEQVAACLDLDEGAPCAIPGVEAGTCRGGLCLAPRCGNGFVEPASGEQCDAGDGNSAAPDAPCRLDCQPQRCGDGTLDADELCDDFNQISGDACSSDCRSLETCGNEYVDTVVGEQCDAGAGLNGDGCASACLIEIDTGREVDIDGFARVGAAAAMGPGSRPIVFGGKAFETTFGDTLRWTGEAWVRLHPPTSPSPRTGAAMAYDGARDRVVLFGGQLADGDLSDETWEWDGVTWTQRTPAIAPSGRAEHGLVFDKTRQRIVLFGGRTPDEVDSDETWEYDGTAWTQRALATSPTPRHGHGMAHDAARGITVLFGGVAFPLLQDTWEWDGGGTWIKRTPALVPGGVRDGHMAFDPSLGMVVMVGGEGSAGQIANAWRWTGSNWIALPNAPGPREGHVLVPDEVAGATLLFAGLASFLDYSADTWSLTNGTWAIEQNTFEPGGRREAGLVYDERRGRVVMFGGFSSDARLGDTWEHDGDAWIPRGASGPPPRARHAMAYDAARGETVVFGGFSNLGVLADTWTWDGAAWSQRSSAQAPSERNSPVAAFDVARARVVLFGGDDLDDTWEWDGTQWLARTPATRPPGRSAAAMAYDRRRARIVMFGGTRYEPADGEIRLGDTWEWDGTDWTERAPAVAPPARGGAAMAYDAQRGEVVLLGGDTTSAYLNDEWAWNGEQWAQLAPTDIFTPRSGAAGAYDARAGAVVTFGGVDGPSEDSRLWRFRLASASAPPEACLVADADTDSDGLAGCADPDCWSRCTPACAPGAPCDLAQPRCGDASCNAALEDYVMCPSDCAAP